MSPWKGEACGSVPSQKQAPIMCTHTSVIIDIISSSNYRNIVGQEVPQFDSSKAKKELGIGEFIPIKTSLKDQVERMKELKLIA